MTRMASGDDRRVVRQGDRGQARHRTVLVAGAQPHEARHVRRFAACRHVVEHIRIRTVEQESDHVLRATALHVEHVEAHFAVLTREVGAIGMGRRAEEVQDRGRHINEAPAARHETVVAHALARDHERSSRLHHAE